MSITDIEECPLGRALRGIREEQSRQPAINWSRIPLGQFFELRARELAERRKSNDTSRLMRIKWLERARLRRESEAYQRMTSWLVKRREVRP